MDREAWPAVIHGVAKSQTWLSDWTELNWTELNWSIAYHSLLVSSLFQFQWNIQIIPSLMSLYSPLFIIYLLKNFLYIHLEHQAVLCLFVCLFVLKIKYNLENSGGEKKSLLYLLIFLLTRFFLPSYVPSFLLIFSFLFREFPLDFLQDRPVIDKLC